MKIAGISFDHMHMGDLLRHAHEHPDAQIVGICDDNPQNVQAVQSAVQNFAIPDSRVYTNYQKCLDETQPDIVILCSSIGSHADWVEKIAPSGAHIMVEKPFAMSLRDADRMVAACEKAGSQLVINWPLAWYRPYNTTKRLLDEGTIGQVLDVRHYGGNSGPMRHLADKQEVGEEEANRRKNESWFYKKSEGGGSLIDYMGYGTTLGTWFFGGKAPIEVTTTWDIPAGLEVDEHSLTVARYDTGLSKFETRWGTFTNPWQIQPQPKCGFEINGTLGTIAAYDYDTAIRVQTREKPEGFEVPVDELKAPNRDPIEHFIAFLRGETALHPVLDPKICRIGQQIVDSAIQSAQSKCTVELVK